MIFMIWEVAIYNRIDGNARKNGVDVKIAFKIIVAYIININNRNATILTIG